ncbi:MAG TPA: hypothetical protein VF239_08960 [Vicinamibacterales bacterium]
MLRHAAFVLVALPLAAVAVEAQVATGRIKDNPGDRLRYFIAQRADETGKIPRGAFARARKQVDARFPGRHRGLNLSIAQGQAVGNGWTAIGPNNVNINIASSGRLTAIAVHPTTPTTIFAAGAQGGVWKTTNGGTNWTPVTDDQCSLAMGSIVIDQVNPDIIYAGTGELHNSQDSYYGCGVLRSIDGGTTWAQMGASVFDSPFVSGATISKVVIDRATAGSATSTTVFVTSNIGIYKSTNSGQSWTVLTTGLPAPGSSLTGTFADMVADTTTPGTFYASTGRGSSSAGIYKTIDGGATWTKLTTPITGSIGRINIAISQSSPQTLYASAENLATSGLAGIYRTNDRGVTWTQLPPSSASCASQCWYDMHIFVDPTNPEIVYFGGLLLYKSTNGGQTFAAIGGNGSNSGIHVDQQTFAFHPTNPQIIYAGNDGGIYRSTDGGTTFQTLNTDIAIHQFYAGFSVHPTDPNKMMGGSQDNGTNEYNGSPSWMQILGGDGGYSAIDHQTGGTGWATTQWSPPASGNPGGPRRRDAASGAGFALKRNGINADDRGQFIAPLLMDPVNPRVLYFGTYQLYRTRDNGESWTSLGDMLGGGSTGSISSIAVARTDTNQIYVGTSNGRIMTSSNGGATFTLGTGNAARFISDIAVDPTNPAVAYATVSGFGAGHIYKTTNRGVSWTNITSNLPDSPVLAIVIQPGVELTIGTDLGLFRSTDDGATWVPFPGLPNVAVYDLVFNPTTQLLVAATHGRGAFKYTVPAVLALRGDVTSDLVVSALDAQAVLSATVGLTLPAGWKNSGPNADANCDGTAPTAVDAQVILSYVVGLPVPTGACVGKYQ